MSKMISDNPEEILNLAGISITPNRILVVRELVGASTPLSLLELETRLDTLDKSSISRVLTVLTGHDVVHALEDGRGVTKYEICHSANHEADDDQHVHFYCTDCRRTYCLTEIEVPRVEVPDGFHVTGVNFMLKGICPNCSR